MSHESDPFSSIDKKEVDQFAENLADIENDPVNILKLENTFRLVGDMTLRAVDRSEELVSSISPEEANAIAAMFKNTDRR